MAGPRRTALVTGAGRGLGAAVAAGLHALGHRVIVAARTEDDAHRVAGALGDGAVGVGLDVTASGAADSVRGRVGPVDILVNNAGLLLDAGTLPSTVPLELVERQLATNTLGAWRVCQAFLPAMLDRKWGRIVMVSSGTGMFSNGIFPGTPGYSVSKAALNALTVALAEETRERGVLVNAVNPGLVRTRMRPDAATSPEDAARHVVWAAVLPDGGPTGRIFRARRPVDW
ncbi:SDR family NAD(P)-dependent oxidoreductase [Actinoallomurus iriomotensis]|uniref:Short-chain dehydrogenase n=1 Tax=Actinoallomurus iriomotensis TaxID=478107 RepID=A0A9W6VZ95_9ACTN|nr:SDR family NAD(P)-dependent oxidoreductase [Actinoallomurus iriomotensis]GLY85119.1 short-chain dehydrogenase [Actinoallomurus iriomotensis]